MVFKHHYEAKFAGDGIFYSGTPAKAPIAEHVYKLALHEVFDIGNHVLFPCFWVAIVELHGVNRFKVRMLRLQLVFGCLKQVFCFAFVKACYLPGDVDFRNRFFHKLKS